MEQRRRKRAADSFTTQVQVLTEADMNGSSRLFGGRVMSWMDIVAAVTARRHAGRNVTTVSVRELNFRAPARINETVVLTGEVVYVGNTSMEIAVKAYVEELDGIRTLVNEARFIMVALDENENPTPVPGLIIENEEQQQRFDEAAARRKK